MPTQLRILLDKSAPWVVKKRLPAFGIRTVQEMSWSGIKNEELLTRAEMQFDVFVTADKRLRYQQNLAGRRLAIVVLPSNQVPIVVALLPVIEQGLQSIQSGTIVEIPLPQLP